MIPPDKDRVPQKEIPVAHLEKLTPRQKQERHLEMAELTIRQLARLPYSVDEVAAKEARIRHQFKVAGKQITPEDEKRIARAVHTSHKLHIIENFKRLYRGAPYRLAQEIANDIREQWERAAGKPLPGDSIFNDRVSRAMDIAVVNWSMHANRSDTERLKALKLPRDPG